MQFTGLGPFNVSPPSQQPLSYRERAHSALEGLGYLIATISSLATLWFVYYAGACSSQQIQEDGPIGLGHNCQNPRTSLAVNLGLPTFATLTLIKSKMAFERALRG
jgi:hypothetical protein